MVQRRLAHHNIVAVLPTLEAAEATLDALTDDGFEAAGELSLVGPDHEMRPAVDHVSESRGEGATGTGAGFLAGASAGTVAGSTLVGLATVAATAIPGVGMAVGTAALAGVASGASGGGTVGALMGLDAAARRTTMWQQTLSPLYRRVREEHVVLVATHVDDPERAARADEILHQHSDEVHDLTADIDYEPEVVEANVGVTVPANNPDAAGGAMGPGKEQQPQPDA